jgi:hypothetical protein
MCGGCCWPGEAAIYIYRKRERERAGAASGIERKRGDI